MTESINDNRPSPEKFLEMVQREATEINKGRLKIFLGMAAGVGKTYSMLEEAQTIRKEGVNIVVGIVDTHGRKETTELLHDLIIIPPLKITYKGREFDELNLDAIIQTHPAIVLVDELAHSNIPGTRHPKRWQDVLEILENGIDVYTTLNIQHIESLNDVVKGITEISVKETVPDFIVEQATSIHIVDLTPDELLERLKEGKVYLGEQAQIAVKFFFQKDRLTALREVALRFAAEKVDRDLHEMRVSTEKIGGWKPREKLLVAVSSSPHSQKLIRTTRRLASHLDAAWIAAHVDNGSSLTESQNSQLSKNLTLARILGGEVVTTSDTDIAVGVARIAERRNVTQIVIGHPPPRPFLIFFPLFSLTDRLLKILKNMDLHVIGQEPSAKPSFFHLPTQTQFFPYFIVTLIVIALTGLNLLTLPLFGYKVAGFIFLLGILGLSLFFRKGPVLFASVLYALSWQLFFVPPMGKISFELNEDTALLLLYFFTAIATGILVDRARENKEMLLKREETSEALYDIVRHITVAFSLSEITKTVKEKLGKLFKGSFEIIIKKINDGLDLDHPLPLLSDEKEKNAAIWVFENAKEAGWSTDTLPSVQNLYLPLKGYSEIMGVLVYRPKGGIPLSLEDKNFLYTVGHQLANYFERIFTEKKLNEIELRKKEEKIYLDIFKSNAIPLQPPPTHPSDEQVKEQQLKIEDSTKKLIDLLDNMLGLSKLNGNLIKHEKHTLKEVIDSCTEWMKKNCPNCHVKMKKEKHSPPLLIDLSLVSFAYRNMLQFAAERTIPSGIIKIETSHDDHSAQISVSDEGPALTIAQRAPPFVNFHLMLIHKIAEINKGSLKVENLPKRGAIVTLILPIFK